MLLFLTGTFLGGGTMEFQIPCTTWVKEADEKGLFAILQFALRNQKLRILQKHRKLMIQLRTVIFL